MTEKQLRKFIKIRNASSFSSNFQFASDAEDAGFKVGELGEANRRNKPNGSLFYWWKTPFGILVERFGTMRLFKKQAQS